MNSMNELRERVHENVDLNFEPMVRDISSLIKYPSVLCKDEMTDEHPFGPKLSEALGFFLELGEKMSFRTKNVSNAAGYAEAGEGPLFGVLVHLDVVPPGKASMWKHGDPFSGTVDDGRIYGRGAIDDKGPAVSSLYALKALVDAGVPLKKRFRIIAGLDEENGFRCMARYKQSEEIPEGSFSPDSIFPVVNAEKGLLQFTMSKKISNMNSCGLPELFDIRAGGALNVVPDELKMFFKNTAPGYLDCNLVPIGASVTNTGNGVIVKVPGRAAHASRPGDGDNAIQKFLAVVETLDFGPPELHAELVKLNALLAGTDGGGLGLASSDDISGPLTCNFAKIYLEDDGLSVGCDIRYPVSSDSGEIMEKLAGALKSQGWSMEIAQHDSPMHVDGKSPLVLSLLKAYEAITGEDAAPVSIGGGTYSRTMPNSVSFGAAFPSDERTAHKADEYISLESLRRMTHIYAEAMLGINE